MRGLLVIGSVAAGAAIAALAFLSLQKSGDVGYHNNPLALRRSAYGTVLARLGQKNLDRAWHYGAVASEISQRGGDEHEGHDHEKGEGHQEEEPQGDPVAHGHGKDEAHKGVDVHEDGEVEDEHAGHDHVEGGGHEKEQAERESWVESALLFLVALDAERFRRTSQVPRTEKQERVIAQDIENLLLRSYNMDPTDYGVYDSYFHFLLYHPLRGDGKAVKHAYSISEHTIKLAGNQKVDPMPFLTSAIATLNQFFLHLADYRRVEKDAKVEMPVDVLEKYQERMKYCMTNYFYLKKKAVEAGRWNLVPVARRIEGDERARQAMKMMEQFAAMIERGNKEAGGGEVGSESLEE